MRRIILRLTMAALMAAVMLMLAAGPAFAPDDCASGECNPIERPSRAASLKGLGEAAARSPGGESQPGTIKLTDLIVTTQDPSTPGVAPGGGVVVEP